MTQLGVNGVKIVKHIFHIFLGRSKISELHGNMFVEKCDRCETEYVRRNAVTTVGLKKTGGLCERKRVRGHCRFVFSFFDKMEINLTKVHDGLAI